MLCLGSCRILSTDGRSRAIPRVFLNGIMGSLCCPAGQDCTKYVEVFSNLVTCLEFRAAHHKDPAYVVALNKRP